MAGSVPVSHVNEALFMGIIVTECSVEQKLPRPTPTTSQNAPLRLIPPNNSSYGLLSRSSMGLLFTMIRTLVVPVSTSLLRMAESYFCRQELLNSRRDLCACLLDSICRLTDAFSFTQL